MARKGRSLELLVAHLERCGMGSDGVTIESPGFLTDKTTGRRREFDVLATLEKAHHTITIAIEVKDFTSRKVGSPEVEAFETKTRDVGANGRVIVSGSGFTGPALKKAKLHSIRCLTLQDAVNLEWFAASQLSWFVWIPKLPAFTLFFPDDAAEGRSRFANTTPMTVELVDSDGNNIAWNDLMVRAWQAVQDSQPKPPGRQVPGEYSQTITFAVDRRWSVRDAGSTELYPLRQLDVTVPFVIEEYSSPFEQLVYGEDGASSIAEVVRSGPVPAPGGKARLTMVKHEGKDIQVSLVFDPDTE